VSRQGSGLPIWISRQDGGLPIWMSRQGVELPIWVSRQGGELPIWISRQGVELPIWVSRQGVELPIWISRQGVELPIWPLFSVYHTQLCNVWVAWVCRTRSAGGGSLVSRGLISGQLVVVLCPRNQVTSGVDDNFMASLYGRT